MKCHLALKKKKKKVLTRATVWMNPKTLLMMKEVSLKGPRITLLHLDEMSRIGQLIETE